MRKIILEFGKLEAGERFILNGDTFEKICQNGAERYIKGRPVGIITFQENELVTIIL
jgi:hypothetical protein